MLLVTWNINSIRARMERFTAYLAARAPDVLCLQETKVEDASFPREVFEQAGYAVACFGQRTYNGVAIAVKRGLELADVRCGMPGETGEADKRVIAATVGGIRVIDAYVPNGQAPGSPKYAYKLEWFQRFRDFVAEERARHPDLVVCGDFNVAPDDRDLYDPEGLRGTIMVSDPERAALQAVMGLGLQDLMRRFTQDAGIYTWWDYRMLGFPKNRGFRIDLVLAPESLAARCQSLVVDRNERKGKDPSDHAPVATTFALG